MKFLSSLILESEDFSLNDLDPMQRAVLRRINKLGTNLAINPEKLTPESNEVLDSLVDLGLLDIDWELTREGRHAMWVMGEFENKKKGDKNNARQEYSRRERNDLADVRNVDDNEYYEGFTPGQIAAMKASGLKPEDIREILGEEEVKESEDETK